MGGPRRRLHAGARGARRRLATTQRARAVAAGARLRERAARQRRAPKRRTCRCWRSIRPTTRRAGGARSHLRSGRDVAGAGRHPRPAHRRHHRHRRDRRALLPARARLRRRARRLGRGGRGYNAILDNDSRNRRALEALERVYFNGEQWAELYGDLREDGRHRPRRRGHGRLLRAHGEDRAATASTTARRRSTCGAASSTCAARIRSRSASWRTCTSAPSSGASSSTSSSGTVRITHDPQEQIPLYQRLGRIWGEKLHRERNSLEAWQKVLEIDPTDIAGAARAGGDLQVDAGVGRAGRDAAQADRHRLGVATWSRTSSSSSTPSSARCRARS